MHSLVDGVTDASTDDSRHSHTMLVLDKSNTVAALMC